MKTSQWCRAVENRCVFSARSKVLSDRSGDHSAGGRRLHMAGPLTAKLHCPVAVENRCVFSACSKALSDRSGDHSAGGRWFHMAGPLTAKLHCPVAVRARGTSR